MGRKERGDGWKEKRLEREKTLVRGNWEARKGREEKRRGKKTGEETEEV